MRTKTWFHSLRDSAFLREILCVSVPLWCSFLLRIPNAGATPARLQGRGPGYIRGCLCSLPSTCSTSTTPDLVISGVVDVLQVEGKEHTAPDVRGVEHFLDGFAAVRESAIAQDESQAPVGQICLMRFRDAARYERGSGTVEAAMPARALYIHAQLYAFVIFGVGERLMFPFVPSPAPEGPNVAGN